MPLKYPSNPANDTVTLKIAAEELRDLKLLAAYEGRTLSAYMRSALADLIKFQAAANHPALVKPDAGTPPYGFTDTPGKPAADPTDCPLADGEKPSSGD
jgi:hypothetical protein